MDLFVLYVFWGAQKDLKSIFGGGIGKPIFPTFHIFSLGNDNGDLGLFSAVRLG